jgi:hypothetical protein
MSPITSRYLPVLVALFIATSTFAQQGPPPAPEGGGDNGEQRDGPPGGDRPGPRRGPGQDGPPGMGRPGMPPPPPMADRIRHAEMLRGYLELVDRYGQMAQNPTSAGVAAVITAGDILKAKGNDAAIDYFTKLLPDVKDPSIQRAIRIQLADMYKAAGQADKALEQLRELMTAAPSNAPAAQPAK